MYRSPIFSIGLILTSLFFLVYGCEGSNPGNSAAGGDGNGNTNGGADGDTDSDGDLDSDIDADGDSDAGDGGNVCAEQDFDIKFLPVRLMILQDMSGSMSEGTPTKWSQAKGALNPILDQWGNDIEFGFDRFPNDNNCGVSAPVIVDCASGNAANIKTRINAISPNGHTPLYCAMNQFTNASYAPNFTSKEALSYLLLVSDGAGNCGQNCSGNSDESAQLLSQVTAQLLTMGIKTYVVGFGTGVSAQQLNAIVAAGGTGSSTYINAQNQQDLQNAFNDIASSVVSCTYEIKAPAATADPNNVNFYFDGNVVGYDDKCTNGSGWQWTDATHTRVEFCDKACQKLKSGQVKKISAKFGCPTTPIG